VKVVSLSLVNQRLVANYLDTRGVVADCDAADERLTLTLSSQGPHAIRDVLLQVLKLPSEKLRVITPDVGGVPGFQVHVPLRSSWIRTPTRRERYLSYDEMLTSLARSGKTFATFPRR
jgi:hypothetical protein